MCQTQERQTEVESLEGRQDTGWKRWSWGVRQGARNEKSQEVSPDNSMQGEKLRRTAIKILSSKRGCKAGELTSEKGALKQAKGRCGPTAVCVVQGLDNGIAFIQLLARVWIHQERKLEFSPACLYGCTVMYGILRTGEDVHNKVQVGYCLPHSPAKTGNEKRQLAWITKS
jgi:hypothetical protein